MFFFWGGRGLVKGMLDESLRAWGFGVGWGLIWGLIVESLFGPWRFWVWGPNLPEALQPPERLSLNPKTLNPLNPQNPKTLKPCNPTALKP